MTTTSLERLLRPQHVAFLGGRSIESAVRNCEALGFDGEVWVVNPHHDELAGHRCYPSIADLPHAPDAAFVGVDRTRSIEAVRALAQRGAGGCVCMAAGFAEVGDEGRALQDELIRAAGPMAVVGPNCYGVLNYADGVALWPDLHGGGRVATGAALVAQSGNLCLNATMADRSLPLTHVLSIGNQAVTGFGDYVDVLIDDPRVHAIGLYVEDVVDVASFHAATGRAREAAVPLVALRSGASESAGRITLSHTGSRATTGSPIAASFDELGIIEVGSPSALLETLKLLTVWKFSGGPRIAALAASGGDLAVLADLAAPTGLTFPPLGAERADQLREQLGALVTVANPLDYNTGVWGRYDELERCFTTVLEDDVDVAVLVIDYPRAGMDDVQHWDAAVDAFVAAHQRTARPAAVVSTLPEGLPRTVRERLMDVGVAPLQGMTDAVIALAGAAQHAARGATIRPSGSDHATTS